jgi:hypothetical protein
LVGSEVTLSGLAVLFAKLVGLPGREEISPILEVLFTSLPLTIAIAAMFVQYRQGKLTLLNALYILGGAVLVSWVLVIVLDLRMALVPVRFNFGIFGVAASYLVNYLTMYGPFPFFKSIVLGYFFRRWYLRLAVVPSKLVRLKQ